MSTQVDEFRAIFHATHPKVVAYARRRADNTVADDVVAETFLVAWRRRSELMTMDNPLPWLYAVAGNQLRNQHRSANRHLRLVSKVAGQAATDTPVDSTPAEADPAVTVVRSALATLSFDDREVLRLIAWEELTYQEAADTLGCSLDAVAQRIRRARQRLATAIDNLAGTAPTDAQTEPKTHTRGA
ncbi:MAG: RNA polymerase sigma factor [Acidimicrobiia bacterium]|nr:RNA polymerase sigma factor [Acidimicrobiia bacterium]MDH5519661.1 RNA polymerase sigma factor [Acidimicrobiia bacterium]